MRPARTIRATLALLLAMLLPAATVASAAFAAPADAATDAATGEPTPAYPTASSVPEDTEGQLILPGLSDETENFQFAVKESAAELIDTAAVMAAAAELLEGTGLKLAVAVDQEPASVSSAGQLIRGMLLFGPIDALSDDWLENGKTRGYVGKDWVVIGIILPEAGQGKARVGVDLGRNVKLESEVEPSALVSTGVAALSTGNATEGVITTIESVVSGVERSADYTGYALAALAVLVVLAGIIAIAKVIKKRRLARDAQTQRANARIGAYAHKIERLGYRPLAVSSTGPAGAALDWLAQRGPQVVARALAEAPNSTSPRRAQAGEYADIVQKIFQTLEELESWRRPAKQRESFRIVQEHHREQLEAIPPLLQQDTSGRIKNAATLRRLAVEHTDALDALRALNTAPAKESAAQLLDRHWQLRAELDAQLRVAVDSLRGDAPPGLRQGELTDPDIYERLSRLVSGAVSGS